MSAPSSVVVPTGSDGAPDASKAAAATPMKGGMMLSPLPLSGGRKGRKTRRISKKVLKMLKAMPKKKLAKLMKGGQEMPAEEAAPAPSMGGRTHRSKSGRKSHRGSLFY